jgi:hypothetical protein
MSRVLKTFMMFMWVTVKVLLVTVWFVATAAVIFRGSHHIWSTWFDRDPNVIVMILSVLVATGILLLWALAVMLLGAAIFEAYRWAFRMR